VRERRVADRRARARFRVTTSFVLVVVVAILAVLIVGCQEQQTRDLSGQTRELAARNRDALHALNVFRRQRSRDVTATAKLICRKQNKSNRVLAEMLKRLLNIPPPSVQTPAQLRSRTILKQGLAQLKPQNCERLPVSGGPNPH
jgi:hypothetical protein